MPHTIQGKVARILSDAYLVINLGSMHGVRTGTVFTIVAEGDEVKDPDTGQVLGRWEMPKGRVAAVHVQDRMCTCQACPETTETPAEDRSTEVLSADMVRVSMRSVRAADRPAKLNVSRADVSGMPRIGPIVVGDRALASIDLDATA